MIVGFNFEANENDVIKSGFDPLEPGDYKARVTKCEFGPTSDGNGQQFSFQYTVIEGECKNKTIRDSMYWTHTSPDKDKAVSFGHRKFASVLIAIGHPHFNGDTDELLGGEFIVTVDKEQYTKNDGKEGFRNNVKEYKSCGASQPQTIRNAAPVPPTAPKGPVLGNGTPTNPFFGRK